MTGKKQVLANCKENQHYHNWYEFTIFEIKVRNSENRYYHIALCTLLEL